MYKLILRNGECVIADEATARRLIKQGKVLSVKAYGNGTQQRQQQRQQRSMYAANGFGYLTK